MGIKPSAPLAKRDGYSRMNRSMTNDQAENAIKEYKASIGAVVHIAITARTTIELPAILTQSERDERVANYIKLHSSKI